MEPVERSDEYLSVLTGMCAVYSDYNTLSNRERTLDFEADFFLTPSEARDIFEAALWRTRGSYNDFEASLLDNLSFLFESPMVKPGRAGSVGIIVRGKWKEGLTPELIKRVLNADEVKRDGDTWIWWD